MSQAVIRVYRGGPLAALVGNPNCGKTALFNLLTGSHQKVANYAGVTVERKEGRLATPDGKALRLLDLPGAYSLHPRSPDERITCDVLLGRAEGEKRPDLVVCVVDATNLRRSLRLVLAVKRLAVACVVALNMTDVAKRRGLNVDADALSAELGLPVVPTVGITANGADALRTLLDKAEVWRRTAPSSEATGPTGTEADHETVRRILQRLGLDAVMPDTVSDRIDRVVLHPVIGPVLLAIVLFLVFQAVFAWAEWPMNAIEAATAWLGEVAGSVLPEGWVKSLIVNGLIAGVGGVVVFLPADRDPVRFHSAAGGMGLPSARGVPARPSDGQRRIVGPLFHSALVEFRLRDPRHHGRPHHRQSARSDGHDHDRAAHDVLGAASRLCAAHRRFHSEA